MRIGLALPLEAGWEWLSARARRAEGLGLSSVWLADGGEPLSRLDPLMALAGLSRATTTVELGATLDPLLRPPAVAAKALATSDLISAGRLQLAIDAGGHPAGGGADAAEQLAELVQVMRGAFGGGPFTFHGRHLSTHSLRCRPLPRQRPAPPLWIVGSERRVVEVAARHGDGWMPGGSSGTPEEYRSLRQALDQACAEAARDPAAVAGGVRRAVLVGDSEADVRRRWERAAAKAPPAGSPGGWPGPTTTLDGYRRGRLVGTVEQVSQQVAAWRAAGVATLVLDPGALAFPETTNDDVDLLSSAALSGR